MIYIILTGLAFSCSIKEENNLKSINPQPSFDQYWYQGKAEITSYDYQIIRYGEKRNGEAVLIFVTEPFSMTDRVKSDKPDQETTVTVLKLNKSIQFNTGIYQYSHMTSVFTPVSLNQTLKISYSCQEWCGQVYSELNHNRNEFQATLHSYFQGDNIHTTSVVKADFPEEDLWTTIRINPELIKLGEYQIIPSAYYTQFFHIETKGYKASIEKKIRDSISTIIVNYSDLDRKVYIDYTTAEPYTIQSWIEMEGKDTLTSAVIKNRIRSQYWNQNTIKHAGLRDSLNLTF